ncbi:uncharacterized protein MELLADRAFT_76990 [Melampsora larici-populina 98AG31]|uniref:Uncharacterized protein n=1 Tax=Melampsora larici-populina (strain 98AG31 / pathotype 3-4-7) TaxID=747676 RepID=F4RC38_MELLP|nr:uncharacterized protein MELLADRAFT_76990 [Melampsora larici-populina 98AG31]EGG10228.1 hypothetical protein MELLADRAFT_76990 [Melampsora larici-populina 98AG31]
MPPSDPSTITDPRFNSLYTDPRFLRPSKRAKTKALDDDRFQPVAKPSKQSTSGGSGLKQKSKKPVSKLKSNFVDLARGQVLLESSDEEDSSEEEQDRNYFESSQSESDEEDDLELELGGASHQRRRTRGDEQSDFYVDLDESKLEELPEAENSENQIKPTKRIAVVNLDWDHVKPIDLFKVFSSLLSLTAPARSTLRSESNLSEKGDKTHVIVKGQVIKVSIFKSQFGKEQMSKEDVEGPPRELFKDGSRTTAGLENSEDENSDDELAFEDEGAELDEEALRRYQLNRLRYFYAVVELDSVDAAAHVYEEIEGTEFERTANVFDLSYVPEDMVFEEGDLHDECKEDSTNYKGVDYATDALRHSKVKLTWDAEDPHRTKVTRRNTQKMTREELDELDFRAYVAPPSSDEDNSSEHSADLKPKKGSNRSKLRDLLGLSDLGTSKANETQELDITFVPAFSQKEAVISESNIESTRPKKLRKSDSVIAPHVDRDNESGSQQLDDSEKPLKKSKKGAKEKKNRTKITNDDEDDDNKTKTSGAAELELLFDVNEEADPTRAHFDINQIVKAEKLKGRSKLLKKMKRSEQEALPADHFDINTADERFAMVYNDHEFAIDPSNPQYKKTKNMSKLLQVARSQRERKSDSAGTAGGQPPSGSTKDKTDPHDRGDDGLGALVASLKKQSTSQNKRKR